MPLGLALLPDFGGAAAFDDEHDLLIKMPLDIERAGGRHLDHVAAPQAFGAVELDVAAASAEPLPRHERQILDAPHADAAIDRHAFRLHEAVIGHGRAFELAEAGVLAGLGFVPMDLVWRVVHGKFLARPRAAGPRSVRRAAGQDAAVAIEKCWRRGRDPVDHAHHV